MIELKGIIQHYEGEHKYVDVVVTEDKPDIYVPHRMGVDIKVNRGTILTFLAATYGVRPGDIVWHHHIKAKNI